MAALDVLNSACLCSTADSPPPPAVWESLQSDSSSPTPVNDAQRPGDQSSHYSAAVKLASRKFHRCSPAQTGQQISPPPSSPGWQILLAPPAPSRQVLSPAPPPRLAKFTAPHNKNGKYTTVYSITIIPPSQHPPP